MKKIILLLILGVLLVSPAFAKIISNSYDLGGYIVTVQEIDTALNLQISSWSTNGYALSYYENSTIQFGENIKHILVAFDAVPTDSTKPAQPKTIYKTTFNKDMYDKVLLTIKTSNVETVKDQEIWSKEKTR